MTIEYYLDFGEEGINREKYKSRYVCFGHIQSLLEGASRDYGLDRRVVGNKFKGLGFKVGPNSQYWKDSTSEYRKKHEYLFDMLGFDKYFQDRVLYSYDEKDNLTEIYFEGDKVDLREVVTACSCFRMESDNSAFFNGFDYMIESGYHPLTAYFVGNTHSYSDLKHIKSLFTRSPRYAVNFESHHGHMPFYPLVTKDQLFYTVDRLYNGLVPDDFISMKDSITKRNNLVYSGRDAFWHGERKGSLENSTVAFAGKYGRYGGCESVPLNEYQNTLDKRDEEIWNRLQ